MATTEPDTEELTSMLVEIDAGVSEADSQYASRSDAHRDVFRRLEKQVRAIKAKGGQVEIPSDSWF